MRRTELWGEGELGERERDREGRDGKRYDYGFDVQSCGNYLMEVPNMTMSEGRERERKREL